MRASAYLLSVAGLILLGIPHSAHGDDGDVINSVAFPGSSVWALTVAPYDWIYVPDRIGTTTYIFDLDLNVIGFLDNPTTDIYGIAWVDPPGPAVATLYWLNASGTVYVTDLGGILLDVFTLETPFGGTPTSLTWDEGTNRMWSIDLFNGVCFEFFLDGDLTGNIFLIPSFAPFAEGISKVGGGAECFDLSLAANSGEVAQVVRVLPNGEVQGSVPATGGVQTYEDLTWHPTGSTGTEVVYATRTASGLVYEVELNLPRGPTLSFIRGDCDGDGTYNAIADGLYLLAFGFNGGPPPPCMMAADVDGNAETNSLADGIYVLTHGFAGGPPPPPPFPECGEAASPLSCDSSDGCDP